MDKKLRKRLNLLEWERNRIVDAQFPTFPLSPRPPDGDGEKDGWQARRGGGGRAAAAEASLSPPRMTTTARGGDGSAGQSSDDDHFGGGGDDDASSSVMSDRMSELRRRRVYEMHHRRPYPSRNPKKRIKFWEQPMLSTQQQQQQPVPQERRTGPPSASSPVRRTPASGGGRRNPNAAGGPPVHRGSVGGGPEGGDGGGGFCRNVVSLSAYKSCGHGPSSSEVGSNTSSSSIDKSNLNHKPNDSPEVRGPHAGARPPSTLSRQASACSVNIVDDSSVQRSVDFDVEWMNPPSVGDEEEYRGQTPMQMIGSVSVHDDPQKDHGGRGQDPRQHQLLPRPPRTVTPRSLWRNGGGDDDAALHHQIQELTLQDGGGERRRPRMGGGGGSDEVGRDADGCVVHGGRRMEDEIMDNLVYGYDTDEIMTPTPAREVARETKPREVAPGRDGGNAIGKRATSPRGGVVTVTPSSLFVTPQKDGSGRTVDRGFRPGCSAMIIAACDIDDSNGDDGANDEEDDDDDDSIVMVTSTPSPRTGKPSSIHGIGNVLAHQVTPTAAIMPSPGPTPPMAPKKERLPSGGSDYPIRSVAPPNSPDASPYEGGLYGACGADQMVPTMADDKFPRVRSGSFDEINPKNGNDEANVSSAGSILWQSLFNDDKGYFCAMNVCDSSPDVTTTLEALIEGGALKKEAGKNVLKLFVDMYQKPTFDRIVQSIHDLKGLKALVVCRGLDATRPTHRTPAEMASLLKAVRTIEKLESLMLLNFNSESLMDLALTLNQHPSIYRLQIHLIEGTLNGEILGVMATAPRLTHVQVEVNESCAIGTLLNSRSMQSLRLTSDNVVMEGIHLRTLVYGLQSNFTLTSLDLAPTMSVDHFRSLCTALKDNYRLESLRVSLKLSSEEDIAIAADELADLFTSNSTLINVWNYSHEDCQVTEESVAAVRHALRNHPSMQQFKFFSKQDSSWMAKERRAAPASNNDRNDQRSDDASQEGSYLQEEDEDCFELIPCDGAAMPDCMVDFRDALRDLVCLPAKDKSGMDRTI